MSNLGKSILAACLCAGGLIGASGTSGASQQCTIEGPFLSTKACTTANGKVSAFVTGSSASNGTLTTNLTKGVDTGVASTRDFASGAGLDNARLIVCARSDFNPSSAVFRTVTNCAGSTIISLIAVDNP